MRLALNLTATICIAHDFWLLVATWQPTYIPMYGSRSPSFSWGFLGVNFIFDGEKLIVMRSVFGDVMYKYADPVVVA